MLVSRSMVMLFAIVSTSGMILAVPTPAIVPLQELGSASPKAASGLGSKIAKALTPKPASYHGYKSGLHAASGAATSAEAAYYTVAHPVKGLAGSAKAGAQTAKNVARFKLDKAVEAAGKTVAKPIVGVGAGLYTGIKAGGMAAVDFGSALYHGAVYPVAKLHEAVRGKPSAARVAKYEGKLQKVGDKRLRQQENRIKESHAIDFWTLGRIRDP